MDGIKKHTHQERMELVKRMVPQIQAKLGENLRAIAIDGSCARNADLDYSDLELIVFVENTTKLETTHEIADGMLTVLVYETKESYIQKYVDISDVWHASGSGGLLPIYNEEFIDAINAYKPTNISKKCRTQVKLRWSGYQEITAKVLNACLSKDSELLALAFPKMVVELLIILSYANQTPYKTLGSYITQAQTFKILPQGFTKLIDIYVRGEYANSGETKKIVEDIFTSMEHLLEIEYFRKLP